MDGGVDAMVLIDLRGTRADVGLNNVAGPDVICSSPA